MDLPGFSCPGVPVVPAVCIFVNIFLFAQVCQFVHISNTTFLFEGVTQCWLSMHHYLIVLFVLCVQLHYEAWVRFVVLSIIMVGIYAFYGQYHANPVSSDTSIVYRRAPNEEAQYLDH